MSRTPGASHKSQPPEYASRPIRTGTKIMNNLTLEPRARSDAFYGRNMLPLLPPAAGLDELPVRLKAIRRELRAA
jgi:hypothetical protein